MVRLECDLQGGFDDILFDLENAVRSGSIIVNLEDVSDFYFDNCRIAVRIYKNSDFYEKDHAAMNLTLFQTDGKTHLSVITSGDSREPEMFKDDILINAVCDAMDKYCIQKVSEDVVSEYKSGAAVSKASEYFDELEDAEKEAEESNKPEIAYINKSWGEEDIDNSDTEDIDNSDTEVNDNPEAEDIDNSDKEVNDNPEDSKKAASGILLTAAEHPEYEKELMKSTFKHCRNTRCQAFMWEETDSKISKFELQKKNINLKGIFEIWKEERCNINIDYDERMRLAGIILIIIGGFLVICESDCLIDIIHINGFSILFLLFNIILLIAANAAIVLGVSFIIKATQIFFQCFEWWFRVEKFRQYRENKYILNAADEGIKSINEMILHDEQAELCRGRKIVKNNYEILECIFETENLFVIMVEDRDIFAFAKCDMSSSVEKRVRKILEPYYERGYKREPKYSPDQLFSNME